MAHVLVVEDDWMHRDFLVRLLQIKGYEVQVATSGEAAMSEIGRHVPDAVVLDMGLPGISGYEVARLIRTGEATSHLPIVALTAFALGEDYDRAMQSGCDAFETKPVDLDALHAKLQTLIERHNVQSL
ncbi:response regulator [Oscillochloris sp. ZM17-4]|uniref:response regulator n=1 Tax=Oscillochloris sp. ZM17-4 TaxID=2866714 RepID=UPI001C72E570|nr:response regulator [Oscillochloris sp. ZM17-4]MBX0326403.1 response regulator [Oscillochloris sp. ZM17-4]